MPHRLAFLSTAHIHTKSFLQQLSKDELDADVALIWDASAERGQRYAESCGARYVADLDAVLADDSIDGFVICDANTRHLPLLEKALPVGKPMFCEKPLTTSVADAARVAELLQEHDTPLCCGYFHCFTAGFDAVRRAAADGVFGRITHAFFRNSHHACYGRWFDSSDVAWFVDPAESGGGAMMDMGAHAVHLLRHLLGPAVDVQATLANGSGVYPEVDDYGVATFRFEGGALGRAEASWVQHNGVGGGLEIWGTESGLAWVNGKPAAVTAGGEPTLLPPGEAQPDRMHRLVAMLDGRIDAEALRADLRASLDEAVMMEAVYLSAASGKVEPVAALDYPAGP